MLDVIYLADFDFTLSEILLIHRNTFVHSFRWNEYRTGRAVDGFIYCVSGRAVFDLGEQSFELGAGQSVFLPESCSYTVRCESETPFIHYTANFRLVSSAPAEELTAFSEITEGRLGHVTAPENGELYAERFERLLSVWHTKRNGYRVMSKALLYEMLYLYFTDAGRSHRNKDEYDKLRPARHLLDREYTGSHTVAELAAMCELSETHFRRLFLKLYGMSPTEYRLNKRILRAKDLLLSGQYSISDTAHEVGFADANYFTRIFRARVGVPPSEFIRG